MICTDIAYQADSNFSFSVIPQGFSDSRIALWRPAPPDTASRGSCQVNAGSRREESFIQVFENDERQVRYLSVSHHSTQ